MTGFHESGKQELLSFTEFRSTSPVLQWPGSEFLVRGIFTALRLDKVNDFYGRNHQLSGHEFIDQLIAETGIRVVLREEDLRHVPAEGGFITVSNHPYGGIDGILLAGIINGINPGYKLLVNFLLTRIVSLQQFFLGVNPFEAQKDIQSSYGGLKEALLHLSKGFPLGIFPAGQVSCFQLRNRRITDREWQFSILKFIKRARVPVVPIYFSGHNSLIYNILGIIHPNLRTIKLPSELFNKHGREIVIRIGSPITLKEQDEFREINEYGKLLRMRTYCLGFNKPMFTRKVVNIRKKPLKIIQPVDQYLLEDEIERIKSDALLFSIKEFSIFCAPSPMIPVIMREISRLREITYREVGEGTNKELDQDRFDRYFEQLFIWDANLKRIVGGYRVGKGDEIIEKYGIRGHYINTLFRINKEFESVLRISLELGRSFVVREYQKKPLSLFLLWKGILYLLLRAPRYRYLLGPLSIPNEFSDLSKSLVVEFLKANSYNTEYGAMIKARNPFVAKIPYGIELPVFLRYTHRDVTRLERFIQEMDLHFRIPILLKKYLSVNSEVLGFNVDPEFSNCLDALIMLDLFEVPMEKIESLSKEINDQTILERFRNRE